MYGINTITTRSKKRELNEKNDAFNILHRFAIQSHEMTEIDLFLFLARERALISMRGRTPPPL